MNYKFRVLATRKKDWTTRVRHKMLLSGDGYDTYKIIMREAEYVIPRSFVIDRKNMYCYPGKFNILPNDYMSSTIADIKSVYAAAKRNKLGYIMDSSECQRKPDSDYYDFVVQKPTFSFTTLCWEEDHNVQLLAEEYYRTFIRPTLTIKRSVEYMRDF